MSSLFMPTISRLDWISKCCFFVEGGKLEEPEKNPQSKEEDQ